MFSALAIAAGLSAGDGALQADLCAAAKTRCSITKITDAGTGAKGARLRVAEVAIENAPDVEDYAACRPTTVQYWVLKEGVKPVLLLDLCNDGYGASGVGEDQVDIGPNWLTHRQYGGSALRWIQTNTYRLDPLMMLAEDGCGFHALMTDWELTRWDWARFGGDGFAQTAACGPDGEPIESAEHSDVCAATDDDLMFTPIPTLGAPEARDAALAAPQLGNCAAAIDSSGSGGFVVYGEKGDAADASMRVVMFSDAAASDGATLIVEVEDDALVPAAKRWINADHLEIWTGGYARSRCMDPDSQAVQWGVLMSGDVKRPVGAAPERPLTATVDRNGDRVRYVVTVPDQPIYFTVVYSDSDDSLRQERLIATSRLKAGDASTFGAAYYVLDKARCAERAGRFDVVERGIVQRSGAE